MTAARQMLSGGAAIVAAAMRDVSTAAEAFESRWTLTALSRVDEMLHERLVTQQSHYHEAMITKDAGDVRKLAAAMCRGWVAAASAMENAGTEDDAYMLGLHGGTGTRVAIGSQLHAMKRVRELHGEKVIWITPDEVAALVGGMEALKKAKDVFPGAEVINLYPTEPMVE